MFDIPVCFNERSDRKATALKARRLPNVGWTEPYGDTRRMREVALALLLSQWELSAISISFVRQDVEDTFQQMGTVLIWQLSTKQQIPRARTRIIHRSFKVLKSHSNVCARGYTYVCVRG